MLGGPALLAARRSKHALRAAKDFRPVVGAVAEQVRPENGRRLGELVESTAKLDEVIDGRLHDLSKRVDAQGRELGDIRRHNGAIEEQLIAQGQAVDEVALKFDQHLVQVELRDESRTPRGHEQQEDP